MKFLMMVLVILSANYASAATNGEKLKKAVVKLGSCYGVRDLDGLYVNFYDDGTAYVNSVTFNEDAPEGLAEYPYSKYSLYSRYVEYATVQDSVETTWAVKGSQVLLRLNGVNKAAVSLSIGFKSGFCSGVL